MDWDKETQDKHFFLNCLKAAEYHWFFIQGVQAYHRNLILPATVSFLNGLEASIRVLISQSKTSVEGAELSPYKVLSNNLLVEAWDIGLPIGLLAFPSENDFEAKLKSEKPNRIDVDIVQLRNDLCHGNVWKHINRELGEGNHFFTPECLSDVSFAVYCISKDWATGLKEYWENRKIPEEGPKKRSEGA